MPVKSITKNEAFMFCMDYIAEVSINIVDERKSENIPVLIGHYAIVFDIPILFRTSTATLCIVQFYFIVKQHEFS